MRTHGGRRAQEWVAHCMAPAHCWMGFRSVRRKRDVQADRLRIHRERGGARLTGRKPWPRVAGEVQGRWLHIALGCQERAGRGDRQASTDWVNAGRRNRERGILRGEIVLASSWAFEVGPRAGVRRTYAATRSIRERTVDGRRRGADVELL